MKKLSIDIMYYEQDDLPEALEYIVSDIGLGLTRNQLNFYSGTHGGWRVESFGDNERDAA